MFQFLGHDRWRVLGLPVNRIPYEALLVGLVILVLYGAFRIYTMAKASKGKPTKVHRKKKPRHR